MSPVFFRTIRVIFSLAVAAWAINWVVSSAGANLGHELQQCAWGWVGMTVLLTAAGTAIASYRWSTLLAVQKVYISQWDAFRLTMIGVFFNLFGLGGVGGDVFKMYYVREHAGDRKEEAMLSCVVDRIVGLLGLFVVALTALLLVWGDLMNAPALIKSCVAFVVAISLVGGGGVTLVLSRNLWMPASLQAEVGLSPAPAADESSKVVRRSLKGKLIRLVKKLVNSLDLYRSHLFSLFRALALSTMVHTLATLAVFCLGRAFHVKAIAIRFYFLAVQVANTISAIPVTPGGLGSRDFVLIEFFKFGGADMRYGLIPFALSCVIVFWSVVGGIFFAAAKRSGEMPPELTDEEIPT